MLGNILKKIIGSKEKKDAKIFSPYIEKVNNEWVKLSGLPLEELRDKTTEFKKRIKQSFLRESQPVLT